MDQRRKGAKRPRRTKIRVFDGELFVLRAADGTIALQLSVLEPDPRGGGVPRVPTYEPALGVRAPNGGEWIIGLQRLLERLGFAQPDPPVRTSRLAAQHSAGTPSRDPSRPDDDAGKRDDEQP